ncbi:MAG: response regulator transcription factor [Saccharothrix sp.]|nr:response regulator transcription factor [Saccharothrix sp.]
MAPEPITAVIVDEHAAIVAGVRCWCERADPPITLVDAEGRLAEIWTGSAAADVVILDLRLEPGRPGFGELRRLADSGRRVVVYSHHTDPATSTRCLDLGALAYLTKHEGPEHLIPAIRAAARGVPYTAARPSGADDPTDRPRLSPREVEVLRAWFASMSKQFVAERLHISVKTVDTNITMARMKYANVGRAAPTKSDLVTRALDDGVSTLSELNRTVP